jgi:hypothetical protein
MLIDAGIAMGAVRLPLISGSVALTRHGVAIATGSTRMIADSVRLIGGSVVLERGSVGIGRGSERVILDRIAFIRERVHGSDKSVGTLLAFPCARPSGGPGHSAQSHYRVCRSGVPAIVRLMQTGGTVV